MSNYLVHTREITTAVDEFDFLGRIKPSAVREYFQDMAAAHAVELGVGFEDLKAQGLFWVLNRLSAVIDKLPVIGEPLTITTYPHKPNMVDAIRDYIITDAGGETLIRGTSRWCILDAENKAIRRCAPVFRFGADEYKPEFVLEEGNVRLPEIGEICGEKRIRHGVVNITDIDRNGHMNNARYGDLVVNTCDYEYYSTHTIRAFDFNFLAEMKVNDEYSIEMRTAEGASYLEAKGDSERPIFRARIGWDK